MGQRGVSSGLSRLRRPPCGHGGYPRCWRELRAERLAFIPQSPASALNPVRRLGPLLTELARARGLARADAWPAVAAALTSLDLDRIQASYPHHLSGGMAQRVVTSVALLGTPDVVIADEPTSGLDVDLVERTAQLLTSIADRGAAVLVITHDLELAQRLGGRTSVLYASYLVEHRPTAALFDTPAHPYVTALLDARPQCGGHPIPGMTPELTALPDHCAFADRCTQAHTPCRTAIPALTELADGAVRCVLHSGTPDGAAAQVVA